MADVVIDAKAIADLAVRLGLATTDQVEQARHELGNKGNEPDPFLLVMERRGFLTPWQSNKLLKLEKDGYFLGGYRILYRIAAGSFGRVYRADDPGSGRIVAVKILRRKWSENQHNIELFEREGRLGMNLRHPNIVEILSVSHDLPSRQFFIVMEFVEGGNLRDFLGIRKKLDPPEALRIIEEVTSGLQYALSRGITHRDMKLTNILISSSGAAKLVDFGLAGAMGKVNVGEDSIVDRTVDYAGLEKATNVPPGDTRSDIYFLGCVAYQILCGRPPLKMTRNPRERMLRERFSNMTPIAPIEVGGQLDVIRLVESMTSLNPQERFQTPSQLLEAVREVRAKMEGKATKGKEQASQRTLFLIEKDETLQNVLRDKLKQQGFRVLIAADPIRALERFRQKPYEFLIADAGTVGEEGLLFFERIMNEAFRGGVSLFGILMLGEEQSDWKHQVGERPNQSLLIQPIKLKQLLKKIEELTTAPKTK